jgi:alanine racemase
MTDNKGYHMREIAELTGGKILLQNPSTGPITHLLTDSRKIIYPESSLFIAIRGDRNDGHRYLRDVYDLGVRNFIVENTQHGALLPAGINLVQVKDSLRALQEIAAFHRGRFRYPVIGITGSNGKTIVKEWLFHLLKDDMHVVRSPRSYNSQTGVPLSVWQMTDQHQLGIFEAGISQVGEMEKLRKIIRPDMGIFTFLGHAHDEGFKSREEKLREKLRLFEGSELLVYSSMQPEVDEAARQMHLTNPRLRLFSWSLSDPSADAPFSIASRQNGSTITLRKGSQLLTVNIPFTDEASVANACSCFAFLLAVNRVSTDILKRFADLPQIEMRLQLKEGVNNSTIINDSYNADINALNIALDFMDQQAAGRQRTLILSDILQSGLREKELYAEVARLIQNRKVDHVVAIGPMLSKHRTAFADPVQFFENTDAFLTTFSALNYANQVILLKGARPFRFEKISAMLERRVHETVLEINLNALVQNLNVYRSLLHPGVKLMGMVKAFSYGAGSYEIAKVLEFHRADYLTVAYADEGVTLRQAGIRMPVMVMNPEPSGFEAIMTYNLEPEVYNFNILNELLQSAGGQELSIHIELDCGMKRLGFEEQDIDVLISQLHENPQVRVKSVFAHLAASEEKKHDEFTLEQISRFRRMSTRITEAFSYPVLAHILNSSGIVRFPEAQFDMVRLGIGLYGIDPAEKIQKRLQQIGTLKTVISQIHEVKNHETIGYSRKGKVTRDSKIATVAIGYADGFNRRMGNGKGYMLVNGEKAPVAGSVCMDMTMLDVTHIDCKEGDEVIVFGKDLPVTELAEKTGTIPYEVLTSVSQRVKRVYYWE